MQRRRNHGEDRDEAEQDEGRRRADQIVESVRCIGRGEGAAGSGCGEDRGHVRLGKPRQDDILLAPAQPFAGADQGEGEEAPKRDAGRGAEQVLLDGIAHEEDPAERQRHAADPDRPAGPELLLEILACCCRLRGCALDDRNGDGRPGRFDRPFGLCSGLLDGRFRCGTWRGPIRRRSGLVALESWRAAIRFRARQRAAGGSRAWCVRRGRGPAPRWRRPEC